MRRYTVLIADDHAEWCTILRRELMQRDELGEITCAHDGKEALTHIREHKPDIIVLDLVMPVYDGLYIVGSMREEMPEYRPVLYILSALSTPKSYELLSDLGISYYSVKPIEPEAVVNNILRLSGLDESGQLKPHRMDLDMLIEDKLGQMGAPNYLISTKNLMVALRISVQNRKEILPIGDIYVEAARVLDSKPATVEKNIRQTIRDMQAMGTPLFQEYFPGHTRKITNMMFLRTFTHRFIREANIYDKILVR
ncbi:response regulator [Ruminococcaceae bacterium OttesenSCG-928-L11]|nr:response regulator [Ruminococcaceae bacterium OttesenSCG-928-L11]